MSGAHALYADTTPSQGKTWQARLEDHCKESGVPAPNFVIVSDRRGGRTAWSSSVTVKGMLFKARFWYDGKNLDNAREDAAELAVNYFQGVNQNARPGVYPRGPGR
ncbi:hypothetical protein BO86DRAFT_398603 [Aspergillus japonicus CBS 114.51]|uniref:DRBM domain-containing protein n=3 Tax=Aspergillus TaxID=5052 RepID=A0A2V5IVW9_ASPV1|nr:hypothetical protein BO86DRAFT_398603 [Aspergillus japonicus CBS 114.51]PYI24276.1 hypothetical protein BO99DRAFT_408334 [Aspergillus violaceofuscus CBS 115571]PYI31116.1 hypothetical protein BP00DRAFT_183625 [Aspergillus indologenus CBS 114.80]RAH82921.1 hypothetical protein BO86DRAFT_398603 [Aspergillus japonicus CBS 114.51]